MAEEIRSQAELENLLEQPDKMADRVDGLVREKLGDTVKEQVTETLKGVMDAQAKRPPMVDPNGYNPEAAGANLGFKNFGEFLKTIHPNPRIGNMTDSRLKVLGEGQGDQGGFLVPEEFRAELLSLALEQAVVRPRAMVIPIAQNNIRIPAIRDTSHASTVFGGVRAYWTPESGSQTASEPTFAQVSLTAKKLTGYTTASNELLADSAIALSALLGRMFPEALAYFEDDAFINGDGAGEPLGILNADALITVTKETGQAATTLVAENLDKMYSRMLPSSVGNAVWIAHPDTFPQLASLSRAVGTGGSAIWVSNISDGPPSSIYGRPLIFSEKAQTLGTAGDIYFVDLSYYVIADRQAVTMAASEHVRFTNDEMVWRFVERIDGRPWIDSALTPRNGSNTLSPFVNLAARA